MKLSLRTFALIFVVSSFIFTPRSNADTELQVKESEPEISMDFQDVSLKDILKIFSIQSGLNFIASEAVQDRRITLYLDKVPLSKAMDRLFKANNLSYELDKDSRIFIVNDWGKVTTETETRVFRLKYASVSSSSLSGEVLNQLGSSSGSGSAGGGSVAGSGGITRAVDKLLSSVGSVIEDSRTNSLIVTDTPRNLARIEKVILSLDVSVPQVLLEVEMLDVSKNVVDKMGVDWPQTLASLDLSAASRFTKFPFGDKGQKPKEWTLEIPETASGLTFDPWDASHFGPTVFNFIQAKLAFDFLRTQTDTKFLARPRLLTINNATAEIRISTQEAVGIKTTTTSAQGTPGNETEEAERAETGVVLRVTPQINIESGEITMFIYPKVAEAVASSIQGAATNFRDPEERSTKTMVRVRDGETVVIGGLIRNEVSNVEEKIPILGDIPFVGGLFRHKGGTSDKNKERELLVFITPRIVKEPGMKLAQINKAEIPVREQDVVSGIDRDLIVNSSLNTFEKRFSK